MSHTVIGIFLSSKMGQAAYDDLLNNKYKHEDIDMTLDADNTAHAGASTNIEGRQRVRISVLTSTLASAQLAQEIMDEAGALDMNEALENNSLVAMPVTVPGQSLTGPQVLVSKAGKNDSFMPFVENQLEFTEQHEVPVFRKEVRMIEEITLQTNATETVETVTTTVHHSEVTVERFGLSDDCQNKTF